MPMTSFRHGIAALLALLGTQARAGEVALTFDDLPTYGHFRTLPDAEQLTDKLLAGLKRNHLPAIGFDNEKQLEGPDKPGRIGLLKRWLEAGMQLGNHGYSHLSLNSTPLDAYIADTARGETITAPLLAARGMTEHWFRYPYLETGLSVQTRHGFEAWLKDHGYRVAPVTMENSDWEFADVYDDALARHDAAEAARVREQYLTFTAAVIGWYRKASVALLGREIRFVFLLHASQLNADSVDQLAGMLKQARLRAVPLDEAMRDPAYAIADDYAGPDGDEWLTRWATTLHKDLPYGDLPNVPASVEAAEKRLDQQPVATP